MNITNPSKRSPPLNSIQKSMLIEFMTKHPKLRSGTFSPEFTFKIAKTLWEEIAIKLNAVPGGAKKDNWKSWRKTWQDLKKHTTTKVVKQKNESQKTGGGSPFQCEINEEEEAILNLINKKKIEGIENVRESEINFCFDKENVGQLEVQQMDEQNFIIFDENCNTEEDNVSAQDENLLLENEVEAPDHKCYTKAPEKRKNKMKKLESSLEVSRQMVSQVEEKNYILNEYYKKKIEYLKHKKNHDNSLLEAIKENNEIITRILQVLLKKN